MLLLTPPKTTTTTVRSTKRMLSSSNRCNSRLILRCMLVLVVINFLQQQQLYSTRTSTTTTTSIGVVFALASLPSSGNTNQVGSNSGSSRLFGVSSSSLSLSSSSLQNNEQQQQRTVLVTGGAGYIGSHTCLELLEQPNSLYRVIVVDNLDNSSEESLRRVKELVQKSTALLLNDNQNDMEDRMNERLIFRNCDIRDKNGLDEIFHEFPDISSCIHFAGLKAVGESVQYPLQYYDCNVGGTINLLQVLQNHQVSNFVFSSSATVYGDPEQLPILEQTAKLSATNPYGRTKLFIEEILRDCHASLPDFWNIFILRYFNPIGAHPSGQIGEDPRGIPNNLMPYIAQVCVGRRTHLSVYGNDYDTIDGTGVRDYIHVVDLAKGHVAALEQLYQPSSSLSSSTTDADTSSPPQQQQQRIGCRAVNLGSGQGVSVLELVKGMEMATGAPVPYEIVGRRPGDVATVYADPTLAYQLLNGWSTQKSVQDMCTDTWRWQMNNPYGYQSDTTTTATTTPVVEEEQQQEELVNQTE